MLNSNWAVHNVADLLEQGHLTIGDGYRAKNEELGVPGLPFARAGNINNGFQFRDADYLQARSVAKAGDKVSQPGDVVFTSKGTVGRFCFVGKDTPTFVYSPQLCYWRSLNENLILPRFLYYWMQGREFLLQYSGVKGQTDMADYVSLTDQRRMHITLPPPADQREIAHILGILDDKIELNRSMNETLEAIARALFKSWFVDFDPVRARAEGRQPSGMDAETAAQFPDTLEDSPLRPIPSGWKIQTLAPFIEVLETGSRPPGGAEAEGVPSIGAESVGRLGEYDYSKTKYVHHDFNEAMRKGHVVDGDVLLYKDGGKPGEHPGKKTLVDRGFPFARFCINEHVYRLRVREPLTQHFIYFWLDTPYATDQIVQRATGVAQPGLNRGAVESLPVLVPLSTVAQAFTDVVRPMCDRIFVNGHESRTLAATRDAFLPKLLSGEIRVKDAEKLVEAAV